MVEETRKTLREKIAEDNDFFKSLVDLIPGRVHFSQENKDELQLESASDLSEVDEDSDGDKKRSKKSQRKQEKKKMRLSDPLENKTVTQLQEDLDNKSAAKGRKKKKKLREFQPVPATPFPSSLEELREKLHKRIEELKGKRGHLNPEEWLEKKKLKRKESKLKLKMRRKKEKLNPVKGDHHERNLPNGLTTSHSKPVYNKDGKIVFSKFDFTDSGKSKKKGLSDLTGKDYKKILQNIDKRKEKIKKAQQTDVLAGRELQKKATWEMALGKAEGVKIKDDPALLKKAIKRKEKRKEKTKKNWEARNQTVEDKKQARQDKRQKNLDLRKQTKLKTKLKKAGKKGRIIPGF